MPRAGFSSVHIPRIPRIFLRPDEEGVGVLAKVRFGIHHDTPTAASQAAGEAFVNRLMERKEDREPVSGPELAQAQMMAFGGEVHRQTFRGFGGHSPADLVVNGIDDETIPISNSYSLVKNLPNAVSLAYPDSGHGSLFQFHESFTRQAKDFLASNLQLAPY